MQRVMRVVPVLTMILGLVIATGSASGAAPQRFHDHSTGSFSDTVCGISVDVNYINTNNFFLYADGSYKNTYAFTETFTNPLNGKSVTLSGTGQQTGSQAIVDQQANTVTFVTTYKGLPEKIQTDKGPVLSRDAGFIQFIQTFDLTTGNFISSSTSINKGPHPEADSDGALFCEVIIPALT